MVNLLFHRLTHQVQRFSKLFIIIYMSQTPTTQQKQNKNSKPKQTVIRIHIMLRAILGHQNIYHQVLNIWISHMSMFHQKMSYVVYPQM